MTPLSDWPETAGYFTRSAAHAAAARASRRRAGERPQRQRLARAERARRLVHVLRLHPQERAETPVAARHRVDRGNADLRVGETLGHRGHRARAIVALDHENGFRLLELELDALRRALERRAVLRHEIKLRFAAAARETGEGDQIHAFGRKRFEHARAFAAAIGDADREVIHLTNSFRHGLFSSPARAV